MTFQQNNMNIKKEDKIMAKLSAVKLPKKNGKMIAGYRVTLPKLEMERCGFQEGDELEVTIKKGEVRIKQK